jgi:hypothetical protein
MPENLRNPAIPDLAAGTSDHSVGGGRLEDNNFLYVRWSLSTGHAGDDFNVLVIQPDERSR